MTEALVPYATRTLDDTMTLGKVLAQSGYFADSREAAQAVVKILAGQELGFGPIASMTGVNIIKGKVTLSANLIAAAIKRSGRYNYRVRKMTDDTCEIAFYEGKDEIGVSSFSMADAKAAGLATGDNWRKFPRNMLFARAISNGAKWYCPDLSGGPLYTPDELGATVDGETGEVIDAPAPRIVVERQHETASGAGKQMQDPPAATSSKPWDQEQRPWSTDNVIGAIRYAADKTKNELLANGQWGALIGLLDSKPFDTVARHTLIKAVFGVDSSKDLDGRQRYALHAWAKPAKVDGQWCMDANAVAEYMRIVGLDIAESDNIAADPDGWAEIDAAGVTDAAPF